MGAPDKSCHTAAMKLAWNTDNSLSWLGAIVLVVVASLILITLYLSIGHWSPSLWLIAGLFLLQFLAFALMTSTWTEDHHNRAVFLLWFQVVLLALLYWQVAEPYVAILGIVWVVQVAEVHSHRTAVLLMVFIVMLFGVFQFLHFSEAYIIALSSTLTLGLFHLFALAITQRLRREEQLHAQTAALNRELLATRELLSQQSRQHERLRIARNLHDLLGHHMTALILQLEVATHVTDGKGRDKVEQSLALAKLLLSDLRSAVSELRDEDAINLQEAVRKLAMDIPGLEVKLDFTAAPVVNDIDVAETLLRCIQEALTNVLRHSNADRCSVTLSQLYNQYFLAVLDNGRGTGEAHAGNGLTGMKERVAEHGGEVDWHHTGDGFLLEVKLPVETAS